MKYTYFLFATLLFVGLISLQSCKDEYDEIVTETEEPDTELVVNGTLFGAVTDADNNPMDEVQVEVLLNGEIISKTTAQEGQYLLDDAIFGAEGAFLRVYSPEGGPNFYLIDMEDGESKELNLQIAPFDELIQIQAGQSVSYQSPSQIAIEMAGSAVDIEGEYSLGLQALNFDEDIQSLLAHRGTTLDIPPTTQASMGVALFAGAFHEGQAIELSSDAEFKLQYLTDSPGEINQTWMLDQNLGYWVPIQGEIDQNSITFTMDQFTYVAMMMTCDEDTLPPVAVCDQNLEFLIVDSMPVELFAETLDDGSNDDCTAQEDLVVEIRKLSDICPGGHTDFGPSVTFCLMEEGNTVTVELRVTDEAGNSSTCLSEVEIIFECDGDIIPPTLACNAQTSVFTNPSGSAFITASDIVEGAVTDNCTSESGITLEIRKTTDICGNGSDVFSNMIEFCAAEAGTTIEVEIRATDNAGNSNSCWGGVAVEGSDPCNDDIQTPTAICEGAFYAALLPGETKTVSSAALDEGSWDNCTSQEDLLLELRKSSDICANGSDLFGSSVTFCDAEIGSTIPVELRVTDQAGLSTSCFSQVIVVDTFSISDCDNDSIAPLLVCKADGVYTFGSPASILNAEDQIANVSDNCDQWPEFIKEVRKINDTCNSGGTTFGPSVEICADEVGTTVQLEVRVTDASGNSTTCTRILEIQ